MKIRSLIIAIVMGWFPALTMAQIPFEAFGGHQKASADLMFFRFFRNRESENTRWLFFNRNRASVDYRMTPVSQLPQFGFTEAVSYNHARLRGFAPVFTVQISGSGVYAKAGIQLARISKKVTLFSWLVCSLRKNAALDYFLLIRYCSEPRKNISLFLQGESVNTIPVQLPGLMSFTQRMRVGLKWQALQFGPGIDMNQLLMQQNRILYFNAGVFARYEF